MTQTAYPATQRRTTGLLLFIAALFCLTAPAHAQNQQCRTAPVGTVSGNCASEAFVTNSVAAIPPPSGGTVTEQKNTFGYGLTSSGNCDNTSTNAASPCNAVVSLTSASASLGADVSLSATANYFDGPSITQGSTGTWHADGKATVFDSSTAVIYCKLWDGTTVIASAPIVVLSTQTVGTISLSGNISSPAGNIRISCRDLTNTTGKILFNQTGTSKDSTINAFRLQ